MNEENKRTAKLTVIIGANGTGKTTILKRIIKASPDSRVLIVTPDDAEWTEYPENELKGKDDFLFTGVMRHIYDGSKRDRIVWMGDLHPEIKGILCGFSDYSIIRDSFELLINQAPADQPMNGFYTYSCWFIIALWDYCCSANDRQFLLKHIDYVEKMLVHFSKFVSENGAEKIPEIRFLDWPNEAYPEAKHAGIHALLVWMMRAGSKLLRAAGRNADMCEKTLKQLCRYIPDPEVKALVPGLFFGLRGTDPETLENFRSSGMIHIISVSGTHISLFALVLFLLLAPLPYQFRYSLVILFTFLYAESTGMRVPAFRAFMMFAMFCGLRMFRMYTLSFNTLFLAATLLTLLDPMAIFQAGFQFSFLAVAALLMLSAWQKMHVLPQSERMLLTPSRMISANYVRMSKFKNRFVQVIFSCIIAWLISLPLTLYHQGLWSTGTPAGASVP